MKRVGLDIGDRCIGVAISDPVGKIAQPLTTLNRLDFSSDVKELKKLIKSHQVSEVIVGLPLSLNGSVGPQARKAIGYVGKLKQELAIPVRMWDERLTTLVAQKPLFSARLRRRSRKKIVDKVAASLILQSYLDALSQEGGSKTAP